MLPGSVGTLAEFVLVWCHINIDFRVRKGSDKHLICWKNPWKSFIDDTNRSLNLVPLDLENIHYVETPLEAVDTAKRLLV